MQCREVEVVLEQEGWTPLPEVARAHVATCNSCQSLVSDLSTIVAAAHLLPAEVEPPPRVWASVRAQLLAEGIIRDHTVSGRHSWWHGFSDVFRTRVVATAAVGLLIVRSDARYSPPCCIVAIASYSNFGGLILKYNIR